MKFTSKMGTEQLRKAITDSKFEGEELTKATESLAKRDSKPKVEKPVAEAKTEAPKPKKAPVKKDAKKAAPKKEKAEKADKTPKEKKPIDLYPKDSVSGLVRKMLTPKDPKEKIAACTFGEASAAVEKKFERALHPSEFDRNFKVLKAHGIIDAKRPPRYKPESDKK